MTSAPEPQLQPSGGPVGPSSAPPGTTEPSPPTAGPPPVGAPPAPPVTPPPAAASRRSPTARTRTSSTYAAVAVGVVVLILLLIFIIQNLNDASFHYLGLHFRLPVGVLMLIAMVAGGVIVLLVSLARVAQLRVRARRAQHDASSRVS